MGMEVDKLEEEDAVKFDDEDPRPEDRSAGENYVRAVGHKGMGKDQDMEWLIKDMSNEFQVWRHPSGTAGNIILKSDGEPAILAVRDALAKYHGGIVVQEGPAVGESQLNGFVEKQGKRSGSLCAMT